VIKRACIALVGAALAGCGNVSEQVYLQGLDAAGNLPAIPLLVTDSLRAGQIQVSPRITGMTGAGRTLSGRIPVSGPDFPDSIYARPDHNLTWSIPGVTGGIDLQVAVTQGFAITGGVSTGTARGWSFLDWSAGIGLIAAEPGKGVATRFDAGLRGHSTHVHAPTVVVVRTEPLFGSARESVSYFIDEVDKTTIDLYAGMTLNTRVPSWPANIFLQGGYNRCTLASFEPHRRVAPLLLGSYEYHEAMTDYQISIWSFAGGVYVRFGENIRILAGARCVFTDIEDASADAFWMPCLQMDFVLN
jgi:hypothetical protein